MNSDPTSFSHALLRKPAQSAVHGLRDVDLGAPDVEGLKAEHEAYRRTLQSLGLTLTVLEPLEAFPDSVYVEDPALVFPQGAIVTRPGAPTRLGEAKAIRPELERLFPKIVDIEDGFCEGGDVLVTAGKALIGLSSRTNEQGAEALCKALSQLGVVGETVQPPKGVLHFKTACSLIASDTVLATQQLLDGGAFFEGLNIVPVPEGEEPVANALCINGTVLLADGFPKTAELLQDQGRKVITLPLAETMKLDAGLSCMSLRW